MARLAGMFTPDGDLPLDGIPGEDPDYIIAKIADALLEGAADGAPMHAHLGILGVTGFLMKNLSANPLDYVEGGAFKERRAELSAILDGTNPDLSAFHKRGGKMIVTIGTNDSLASTGEQLDYYKAVLDKMGRGTVDAFARLFVLPQGGHGLSGNNHTTNGSGQEVARFQIPNQYDKRAEDGRSRRS